MLVSCIVTHIKASVAPVLLQSIIMKSKLKNRN